MSSSLLCGIMPHDLEIAVRALNSESYLPEQIQQKTGDLRMIFKHRAPCTSHNLPQTDAMACVTAVYINVIVQLVHLHHEQKLWSAVCAISHEVIYPYHSLPSRCIAITLTASHHVYE